MCSDWLRRFALKDLVNQAYANYFFGSQKTQNLCSRVFSQFDQTFKQLVEVDQFKSVLMNGNPGNTSGSIFPMLISISSTDSENVPESVIIYNSLQYQLPFNFILNPLTCNSRISGISSQYHQIIEFLQIPQDEILLTMQNIHSKSINEVQFFIKQVIMLGDN